MTPSACGRATATDSVDEWLSVTGLDAQTPVEVGEHGLMSLRSALTERIEIAHVSRDLVRFVQERTGDPKLAELLKPENKAALSNWSGVASPSTCWRSCRSPHRPTSG